MPTPSQLLPPQSRPFASGRVIPAPISVSSSDTPAVTFGNASSAAVHTLTSTITGPGKQVAESVLKNAIQGHNFNQLGSYFIKALPALSIPVIGATLSKVLPNTVRLNESSMGASHIMFAQDTASVWAAKMTAMRSVIEGLETTFVEFVESGLFYYTAPLVGHLLSRGYHAALSKTALNKAGNADYVHWREFGNSMDDIGRTILGKVGDTSFKWNKVAYNQFIDTLKTVNTAETRWARKLIGLKAGVVVGVFGALIGEYALNFAKNLLTLKLFKTGDFTDVANLTDRNLKNHDTDEHPTAVKAHKRIKQSLLAALGILASGTVLAFSTAKSNGALRFAATILKQLPFKGAFKGSFDFKVGWKLFGQNKPGSFAEKFERLWFGKHAKGTAIPTLGLGNWLKYSVITLGGIGYLDASRDKLEWKENFTRVWCVVMPYLMFGHDILVEQLRRLGTSDWAKKYWPSAYELFNRIQGVDNSGKPSFLKHNEILTASLEKAAATQWLPDKNQLITQDTLKSLETAHPTEFKAVMAEYKRLMQAKNKAFLAPFTFGVLVVGMTVAWLNRFWTDYRFSTQQQAWVNAILKQLRPSTVSQRDNSRFQTAAY